MLFSKRTLLSAGLLDLGSLAVTDESVVGLELLHGLGAVVDEGKAGALATTVLGAETEDGDLVLVGLVQLGELLAELILGDVRAVGVQDVTVQQIISPHCSISLAILCARSVFSSVCGGGERRFFLGAVEGLYAHDHLLAAQEGVANELARAQSHLRVRHVGWLIVVDRGRRVVFCVGVRSPGLLQTSSARRCDVRISCSRRTGVGRPAWQSRLAFENNSTYGIYVY
jgi:hypothetical protein